MGTQVQRTLLPGASQFQMLPQQQQQQQLIAQVQAQGCLSSSQIYGDMDPRKFRGLPRGSLQAKDGQPNTNDGSIGSPMHSTSSKMNVPQMQQSSKQLDSLPQQQSGQNNRKRKGPSSSGPANSTGTGNTIGPSNSQPSTPSTHLQHVNSMSKGMMLYGADGTGALPSATSQLYDL